MNISFFKEILSKLLDVSVLIEQLFIGVDRFYAVIDQLFTVINRFPTFPLVKSEQKNKPTASNFGSRFCILFRKNRFDFRKNTCFRIVHGH